MSATATDITSVLSIRVINACHRKPLAGAVVTYGAYAALAEGPIGVTNEAGECSCVEKPLLWQVPECGTVFRISQGGFWIHCAGYVSHYIQPSEARTRIADRNLLVVAMVRGRRLAGRVVRSDNSPVSHEPILLVGNTNAWPVQHELMTDEQGGFSWNEAPGGSAFLVMGVGKGASSGVFKELYGAEEVAIVQVPVNWQGLGRGAAGAMVYLAQAPTGLVLPALWHVEGTALEHAVDASPEPINHVIISFSGQGAPVEFFGVGGKDFRAQIRGEISGTDGREEGADDRGQLNEEDRGQACTLHFGVGTPPTTPATGRSACPIRRSRRKARTGRRRTSVRVNARLAIFLGFFPAAEQRRG